MTQRTHDLLIAFGLVAILCASFGAFFVYDGDSRAKLIPPANVVAFADYIEWQPATTEFRQLSVRGATFIEARPPGRGGTFPSGPPGYVFDASGKLIDWTVDSNDDDDYHDKWLRDATSAPITLQEAEATFP